jgi:predicted HTH transcriptional regulator
MSDFQVEMNRVVAGFVAQITELARAAAREMIDEALGKGSKSFSGLGRVRGRGRGAKRTSDELEKMADSFVAYVQKHPGLRIEQINKQLGTTTKDLALPIRKLIAEGALKTKGEKRSTTYFPGSERKKKN